MVDLLYIVEATEFEQDMTLGAHAPINKTGDFEFTYRQGEGRLPTVGFEGDLPVNIYTRLFTIIGIEKGMGDRRIERDLFDVLFWSAASVVINYDKIKDYLDKIYPNITKMDAPSFNRTMAMFTLLGPSKVNADL